MGLNDPVDIGFIIIWGEMCGVYFFKPILSLEMFYTLVNQ